MRLVMAKVVDNNKASATATKLQTIDHGHDHISHSIKAYPDASSKDD